MAECPANTFSGLHVFVAEKAGSSKRCRWCHLTEVQWAVIQHMEYAETPAARNTDPDTSWEAALNRLGGKATDRRVALECLATHPDGLTDFELGDLMDRQQTSAGKRRGELRDVGLVEDSGQRRAAPSGSRAIVWVITNKGRSVAATLRNRWNDDRHQAARERG